MILTIFTFGILALILNHFNRELFKQVFQYSTLAFIVVIFTCVLVKACDHEYELETAKHAQWQFEREHGLPYTSFSGE